MVPQVSVATSELSNLVRSLSVRRLCAILLTVYYHTNGFTSISVTNLEFVSWILGFCSRSHDRCQCQVASQVLRERLKFGQLVLHTNLVDYPASPINEVISTSDPNVKINLLPDVHPISRLPIPANSSFLFGNGASGTRRDASSSVSHTCTNAWKDHCHRLG